MIEAEHLTKSFSYHTKEAGLKNTFRDFFFRKKTEREVVKGVSFHIDAGEYRRISVSVSDGLCMAVCAADDPRAALFCADENRGDFSGRLRTA